MSAHPPGFEVIWERVAQHAGETFRTTTGLEFSYRVPGDYIRIVRDRREIHRSLSRTSFARAFDQLPAPGPGSLDDVQGPSYTWAILSDPRVRGGGYC